MIMDDFYVETLTRSSYRIRYLYGVRMCVNMILRCMTVEVNKYVFDISMNVIKKQNKRQSLEGERKIWCSRSENIIYECH